MAYTHNHLLAAAATTFRKKLNRVNQLDGLYHPVVEGHESDAFKAISHRVSATIANHGDSSPDGAAALVSLMPVFQAWRAFVTARTNDANNVHECAQA